MPKDTSHDAEYEAKLKALHQALDEGEASGIAPPVDWDQWKAERRAERAEWAKQAKRAG